MVRVAFQTIAVAVVVAIALTAFLLIVGRRGPALVPLVLVPSLAIALVSGLMQARRKRT